jgi:hypothetical protein
MRLSESGLTVSLQYSAVLMIKHMMRSSLSVPFPSLGNRPCYIENRFSVIAWRRNVLHQWITAPSLSMHMPQGLA